MLAIALFVTAIIIGVAVAVSAFAVRRNHPSQLPPFNEGAMSQGKLADVGENPLRDKRSFSERLGSIRLITSTYHLVNKRH